MIGDLLRELFKDVAKKSSKSEHNDQDDDSDQSD
jgi:hypothetical protein